MFIAKYTFVIPFQLPWNWSADYQRQTCLELSKKYKVLAYMKMERKFFLRALLNPKTLYPDIPNIMFYIPYDLIPFQRFKFIRELNDTLSFKIMEFFYLNRRKKFLWIFDPFFFPLVKFFEGKTIYDCVDFVSAQNKEILHLVKHFEIKLVREADFFFVNSNALRNKHKSIREPDKILPQGFSFDAYQNPKKTEILFPKDKPIIGFVGAVNQRIDFNLMVNLIRRNPEWNFILWGPKQDNTDKDSQLTAKIIRRLKKFNNFITGLTVNKYEVPNIVKQFDIGIIPYDISQDFNKFCYPMKLFEYFYLGKPVVSTPIEELKRFPKYIKIANSIGGWEDSIKFWLKQPPTKSSKKSLKSLAVANSWMNKISIILDIIGLSIQ